LHSYLFLIFLLSDFQVGISDAFAGRIMKCFSPARFLEKILPEAKRGWRFFPKPRSGLTLQGHKTRNYLCLQSNRNNRECKVFYCLFRVKAVTVPIITAFFAA